MSSPLEHQRKSICKGGYSENIRQTEKKCFFRSPDASNGPMTKLFELGGLQMIPSNPPISNSSGVTHIDHNRMSKFRIWQKWVKNYHIFSSKKFAIIQAESFVITKLKKKWSICVTPQPFDIGGFEGII